MKLAKRHEDINAFVVENRVPATVLDIARIEAEIKGVLFFSRTTQTNASQQKKKKNAERVEL
jgi:hypothetical protein